MPLDEKDRTINEEQAKNSVSVDSSRPVTTVQIRLADGSRLVGQFNHSHTIADVRRFITVYPLLKSHVIRAVPSVGDRLTGECRNFKMPKLATAYNKIWH
jgi:UBX domain-containing protein 1